MKRGRIILLAFLCVPISAFLSLVAVLQALFGSPERALRMEIALDQCGNAALGGSEDETISSRSWLALQRGRPWAKTAVRVIDFFFGPGHCRSSAGI